jgi:hypothetical protein
MLPPLRWPTILALQHSPRLPSVPSAKLPRPRDLDRDPNYCKDFRQSLCAAIEHGERISRGRVLQGAAASQVAGKMNPMYPPNVGLRIVGQRPDLSSLAARGIAGTYRVRGESRLGKRTGSDPHHKMVMERRTIERAWLSARCGVKDVLGSSGMETRDDRIREGEVVLREALLSPRRPRRLDRLYRPGLTSQYE